MGVILWHGGYKCRVAANLPAQLHPSLEQWDRVHVEVRLATEPALVYHLNGVAKWKLSRFNGHDKHFQVFLLGDQKVNLCAACNG